MSRRSGVLLLVGMGAAGTGCDLEFVATDEQPTTDVVVASTHDDELRVTVEILHAGITVLPTVVVAGDTAAAEWLGGGRAVHRAELTADSLDPFVAVRIVSAGEARDFSIPLLVRHGPAGVVGEAVEIPVRFPQEAGFGSWSPDGWFIEVVDAEEHRLLVVQGDGDLPDPLRLSTSMLPPGAAVARVAALRADSHESVHIQTFGAATVALPGPEEP